MAKRQSVQGKVTTTKQFLKAWSQFDRRLERLNEEYCNFFFGCETQIGRKRVLRLLSKEVETLRYLRGAAYGRTITRRFGRKLP